MALYTENLGLYLENDPSAKFKDWREKMNGQTGSNMEKIDAAVAGKQDKLTGTQGQVVGFDDNGNAVAQAAPDPGVESFNGRNGAVIPANGDYTADQVGAVPTSRTINGKELNTDLTLSAADVGALTQSQGDERYLQLSGGTMRGKIKLPETYAALEFSSIPAPADFGSIMGTAYVISYSTNKAIPAFFSRSLDFGSSTEFGFIDESKEIRKALSVRVTGIDTPIKDNDAANKLYVDDAISAAITAALGASY